MYCCTDATTDANVWTNIGAGTGDIQPPPTASGGAEDTYTVDGVDYKSHTFTAASTTFSVTSGGVLSALIVAGGAGGAGDGGSGGGAGGLQIVTYTVTDSTDYTIIVGAGGGSCASNDCTSTAGGNSSAFGTTSIGGGTASRRDGGNGGSGGGAGRDTPNDPGSGTAGQGYDGGEEYTGGSGNTRSGGGGGAGGTGGDASVNLTGQSGIGVQNDYRDGSDEWFAVGGRGGSYTSGYVPAFISGVNTAGSGGHGPTNGVDNSTGTAGQDGIVIIRYTV